MTITISPTHYDETKIVVSVLGCESGDWEAVYVNGVEVEQGHSISLSQFLDFMKKHHDWQIGTREFTNEEMDELGNHFPALDDIPHGMGKPNE